MCNMVARKTIIDVTLAKGIRVIIHGRGYLPFVELFLRITFWNLLTIILVMRHVKGTFSSRGDQSMLGTLLCDFALTRKTPYKYNRRTRPSSVPQAVFGWFPVGVRQMSGSVHPSTTNITAKTLMNSAHHHPPTSDDSQA